MRLVRSDAVQVARRVLHVCESTEGGIGVLIVALAKHQAACGDRVAVAVPSGGSGVDELVAAGALHLPWEAIPQPGPGVVRELASLRSIVAEFEPDVVHLHSSKAGLVGRLLLRGGRLTVMHPNAWSFFAKTGVVRRLTLLWERLAARWADVVLCVSEDERRFGLDEGVRAEYRVLPNGVDLDRFPPPAPDARERARGRLGLGPEPLAVCVGRLHRQKNQAALLDAWPGVRALVPDARLVLLGDGPDHGTLERRAVEGVQLAGQSPDVRPWLYAASVVVQPSRWEGMSLSVLEAMAAGRSVVATDVPGMRELVKGVGGLVPPDDQAALTAMVVERLADPERPEAEGRAARARVEERHDRSRQHRDIDALYDELLAARAGGLPAAGDNRLRVLVVQPYAEPGGSESWLLRLLDATDRLEPEVVLLKDGPFRAELERRQIPVELHSVGARPQDLAAAIAWLARRLHDDPPDVVLGNVVKAQLVAGPAGVIAGVPTVWAKHDHGYDRTLAVLLGRLSTRVVGAVEELAAPTRRRDAVIIPPPRPDREPASRDEARRRLTELGVRFDGRPTVVMAGRLVPFKGVDDAIRALALAPAAEWRLVVAGQDDHASPGETHRLRALADELGVADRVHFAGQVPDVAHWLAAFDALAILTKPGTHRAPNREGFGTAAFEAMLAGVPVVAVSGGAVVRRLEGRAGIGVPPASPAEVADALGRLSDPDVRAAAGRAGREIVADHPSAPQCAAILVDVLRDAANAGGRHRRDQRRRRSRTAP